MITSRILTFRLLRIAVMSIRVSELSKLCGNSKRKQQASTPAINLGYPSAEQVHWEHGNKNACTRMGFDGVPFIILDSKILDCQHGVDRHNYRKTKAQSDAVSLYCRKH